jgi:hypothetical protein
MRVSGLDINFFEIDSIKMIQDMTVGSGPKTPGAANESTH